MSKFIVVDLDGFRNTINDACEGCILVQAEQDIDKAVNKLFKPARNYDGYPSSSVVILKIVEVRNNIEDKTPSVDSILVDVLVIGYTVPKPKTAKKKVTK